MASILLIEDDFVIADQIVAALSDLGHEVQHCGDGWAGLDRFSTAHFDVVVADRVLPSIDGLTLVRQWRDAGCGTPVLVISALAEAEERVRGLRSGADDYLSKPFSLAELGARVESLLRRSPEPRVTLLRVAGLELDLISHQVLRGRRVLALRPKEFSILRCLMRHAGRLVSRRMLFEEVWGYTFDPRNNLIDVHVGRLRRALDETGETPILETRRGLGFILHAHA